MTKDEIKSRISMALKDPILQQGFEVICKENTELKKQDEQLTKAKELLTRWVELFKPKGGNIPKTPIQVETEQFLNEARAMEGQNDEMHNLREPPAHRQETYLQQMRNKNYLRRNASAIYRVLPFFH